MKSQRLKQFVPVRGINQTLIPTLGDAAVVANCRWHSMGGWIADIGFVPFWKTENNWTVNETILEKYFKEKVDACYQWKRQGTNDVYTFVEQGDKLYYMLGNKGQGGTYTGTFYENDIHVIDSNRTAPKQNEIGSQFINLGNHLLIINGRDRALLFSGDAKVRDFGFTTATPQIIPQDVNVNLKDNEYLDGGAALWFSQNQVYGLGNPAQNHLNVYKYKCTMVTDIGAESPLSSEQSVSWTISSASEDALVRYGVLVNLPIGQKGVVARRIYRTREATDNGSTYYFVAQVDENSSFVYADVIPDSALVDVAPLPTASSVITSNFKYGEVWDNRLWLATGSKIVYSDQGVFEQFGLFNYFDLGNLKGGDVTQIKAFYNNLIVMRETAVNIISFDAGTYNISTITESVGTTASNTVVVIPNLGVMFMNAQAVYILTGGLNGGASLEIQKVSAGIEQQLKRLNKPMIHKAIAAYSPREQEVWFHACTDDYTTPEFGFVMHLRPRPFQWSLRTDLDSPKSFILSSMSTTIDGYFMVGLNPNWTIDDDSETSGYGQLKIMANGRNWGQHAELAASGDENFTVTVTDYDRPISEWKSEWYGSNDQSVKTRFFAVELKVMSQGDTNFDFFYSVDYGYEENATSSQKQAKSETVFTTKEDAVFGPADQSITKSTFKVNDSVVTDQRLITLRYDVNTKLCDQFQFGIRSTDGTQWHLLSFNILSDAQALPVLNQSTRVQ